MARKLITIILLSVILFAAITPIGMAASGYIGNRSTHKFHYASCRYVKQMKASNKVTFSSRGEAVKAGYKPCKVCKP